jgi:Na+-driven multidrug efflux pump
MATPKRGLAGRLTLGFSGQAFSRIVFALNTVALVPVLIKAWGVSGYGQWIALTALASYMAYSNFGIVTTAANEMVMAAGANDSQRARRTFQMSLNLTFYIVLPLILLGLAIASVSPISRILRLTAIGDQAALVIISFAAAQLLFQTIRGLMVAALYATGSYALGYYIAGFAKLIELIGVATVVSFFHGAQVSAAAIMAGVAFIDLAIVTICARRAAPWARVDLRVFDRAWVKSQIKPAIGFAVSNFSTMGVLIQGPRVILSAVLGGQAVAIYAIYGTAMRLMDQLLLMLVLPLEVEIAHTVGRRALDQTYKLVTLGTQFSWVLFTLVASFLLLFGPLIFHFWTRGQVTFSYSLMALYLLMSACNQFGRVSAHALISTNRLYGPSFVMLVFSLLAVALGGVLATVLKIPGMVIGGVFGELSNSLVVIFALTRWMDKPLSSFFLDQLDIRASFAELKTRGGQVLVRLRGSA